MIGPKRTLHRRIWWAATFTFPLILALAWIGREEGPGFSGDTLPAPGGIEASPEETWSFLEGAMTGTLLKTDNGPLLELRRLRPLKRPDVLVYLDHGEQSLLLGETGTHTRRQFPIPAEIPLSGTTVRLYSLAHYETIDTYTLKGDTP